MDRIKEPSRNFRTLYFLTGLLILTLLVTAVLFLKDRRAEEKARRPVPLPEVSYYPIPKSTGPDNAPVKLIEYSDFECPSCRFVQQILKEFLAVYSGKIQLTYHHFPLTSHKWSIYAHQAAECMHIQGKFWPFHDMVYEKQPEWAVRNAPPIEIMGKYARACGADMALFASCMADVAVARGIYAEKAEGNRKDVNATPTVFLGEQRFVGPAEMKERGHNAIRKVLGLPPVVFPEKKEELNTEPKKGP